MDVQGVACLEILSKRLEDIGQTKNLNCSTQQYLESSKDPPPPKEPWESPLERKARRHREKAGEVFALLLDYLRIQTLYLAEF